MSSIVLDPERLCPRENQGIKRQEILQPSYKNIELKWCGKKITQIFFGSVLGLIT